MHFFQYNVNFTPITSVSYLAYVLLGKVIAMLLMIWWYIRRPYAAAMQTRHTKLLVLKRLLWAFFLGYTASSMQNHAYVAYKCTLELA